MVRAYIRDTDTRNELAKSLQKTRQRARTFMGTFTPKERRWYVQDYYSGILTGIELQRRIANRSQ